MKYSMLLLHIIVRLESKINITAINIVLLKK